MNIPYNSQALLLKLPDSPRLFLQADKVDKMVRDAFSFVHWDLVGYYRQAAVELHCVAVDNFAIELLRDVYCELQKSA
jgi:hypothetical protein